MLKEIYRFTGFATTHTLKPLSRDRLTIVEIGVSMRLAWRSVHFYRNGTAIHPL